MRAAMRAAIVNALDQPPLLQSAESFADRAAATHQECRHGALRGPGCAAIRVEVLGQDNRDGYLCLCRARLRRNHGAHPCEAFSDVHAAPPAFI